MAWTVDEQNRLRALHSELHRIMNDPETSTAGRTVAAQLSGRVDAELTVTDEKRGGAVQETADGEPTHHDRLQLWQIKRALDDLLRARTVQTFAEGLTPRTPQGTEPEPEEREPGV